MTTFSGSNRNYLAGAVIVLLIVLAGYYLLTLPDNRTASQKVGDAIHDLDQGPDKAARQLENRTPGQKLGDAIKDNTPSQSQ